MDSWITSTLKLIYKGKALLTLIFFCISFKKKPSTHWPVKSGDNSDFYYCNYEVFGSTVFIHQWLLFCEEKQAASTNYKDAQHSEQLLSTSFST